MARTKRLRPSGRPRSWAATSATIWPSCSSDEAALGLAVEGGYRGPCPVVQEVAGIGPSEQRLPGGSSAPVAGRKRLSGTRAPATSRGVSAQLRELVGMHQRGDREKAAVPRPPTGAARARVPPHRRARSRTRPAPPRGPPAWPAQRGPQRGPIGQRSAAPAPHQSSRSGAAGPKPGRALPAAADREGQRQALDPHRSGQDDHQRHVDGDRDDRPQHRDAGVLHGIEGTRQHVHHDMTGEADAEEGERARGALSGGTPRRGRTGRRRRRSAGRARS